MMLAIEPDKEQEVGTALSHINGDDFGGLLVALAAIMGNDLVRQGYDDAIRGKPPASAPSLLKKRDHPSSGSEENEANKREKLQRGGSPSEQDGSEGGGSADEIRRLQEEHQREVEGIRSQY